MRFKATYVLDGETYLTELEYSSKEEVVDLLGEYVDEITWPVENDIETESDNEWKNNKNVQEAND